MSGARVLTASLRARVGPLAIELAFDTGEGTLVLIGPNGSGKTSVLLLLLGVLRSEQARIAIGETLLHDTPSRIDMPVEQRRLGYLPQDYALFPHLSVRENVLFAVRSAAGGRRVEGDEERVDAALHALGVWELAARRTQALSGGEKQRVALARALSVEPRALLLDEPLAALDVHARHEVRTFLLGALARVALPTIIVTHDPADARLFGRRIAVLEAGRLTQLGSWDELAARPASRFVEEFVRHQP